MVMNRNRSWIPVILLLCCGMEAGAQDVNEARKALTEATEAWIKAPLVQETAVRPKYWRYSVKTNLELHQISYHHWAKGGNDNVTMSSYIDAMANYKKGKAHWDTRLQMDYGFLYSADKPIIQKNKDRMLLESTWGHELTGTLRYTVKLIFQSQFTPAYNYPRPAAPANPDKITAGEWKAARIIRSGFFSPGDANLGFGFDWVPAKWLTVNFSPVTGNVRVIAEKGLRRNYGMKRRRAYKNLEKYKDEKDDKGLLINGYMYRGARFQLGPQLTMDANIRVNDNFTAGTQLKLLSDYFNKPLNMRVNWENRVSWRLAKYFTLNFHTNLIYDDNIMVVSEKYPNGRREVQLLEELTFGFSYTFRSK